MVVIGAAMLAQRVQSARLQGFSTDHHRDHDSGHTHLSPGMNGAAVAWQNLLALGITGGYS